MPSSDLRFLVRSVLLEAGFQSFPTEVRILKGPDAYPDVLRVNSDGTVLVPHIEIADGSSADVGKLSSGMVRKHREGYRALRSAGMTNYEMGVARAVHTTSLPVFFKYDAEFNLKGEKFGVPPEVLKSIALRESTGKEGKGASGFTSGKVVHFTKELLADMKKSYPDLFGMYEETDLASPSKSITMAAKRLHILLHRKGDPMREAIRKYGPGRDSYPDEVEAFRKFVEATQLEPVGGAQP